MSRGGSDTNLEVVPGLKPVNPARPRDSVESISQFLEPSGVSRRKPLRQKILGLI